MTVAAPAPPPHPTSSFALRAAPEAHATWVELRAIVRRFVARRVAPRDAEDVLQEVLIRVARGLPELRDDAHRVAWVHQIARNTVADHHRRPRNREQPTEGEAEEPCEDVEAPEPEAVRELASVVTAFVRLLPPAHREALELTDLQGLTQAEAARRAGLSLPGMKSRVQRARAELREMLVACCDIELDVRGSVVECEPRRPPAELGDCCPRSRR